MTALPLFGLSVVALLAGCSQCENEQLSEASSPSGRPKAIAFSRNCGATTAFNVQVSVLPNDSKLGDGDGNVLVADGADLESLAWEGEGQVKVAFTDSPRLLKQAAAQGVTVVTVVPERSNKSYMDSSRK
jgi:hypothetical protein